METVETFGQPKIVRKNGMLVMQIENLPGSSCIFLCYGPKLVGVMIYFLESKRDLRLLHVAVDEEFTIKKNLTLSPPMGLMIDKLIEIASGFANVKTIKIDYLNRSIKI
ncbi:hypothetical protein JW835_09030 [bacterium]|nr:hypothetical protein [bacterium]